MFFKSALFTFISFSLFSTATYAQDASTVAKDSTAIKEQPRHGSPLIPISRQYQCYKEGGFYWPADGTGITQGDCRAAYQLVYHKYIGKPGIVVPKEEEKEGVIRSKKNAVDIIEQSNYQFRQWNETSKNIPRYNDQTAVEEAIPNGQLCSGGNVGTQWDDRDSVWNDKSGLDATTAWRATDIEKTADGKIAITYDATATHDPSFFMVYLSKPGYDPAKGALTWDDLDLLEKVENITPVNQQYKFSVDAKGNTGKRVLYIRWQRIDDVGEGFYSCSDVNIKG
uniref:lytic polysaccharide monooxygenase n=1 Tax=Serratia quinivorans TaxID=137545 RepID=UPI0035C69ED2